MKKIFTPFKSVALLALLAVGTTTASAEYSGVGTFNKISSVDEITSGSYMLVANKKAMSTEFGGNQKFVPVDLEMTGDETSMENPATNLVFDFEVANGIITIKSGDKIVGYTGKSTNFTFNTTPNSTAELDQWKAVLYENNIVLQNVSVDNRYIALNNSGTANTFGPYAESNLTASGYYIPVLFKLEDKGLASPELAFTNPGDKTEIFREGYTFESPATTISASPITYASSNTEVATISDNGLVTLVGTGETVISAQVEANDTYDGAIASYTLTVINHTVSLPYEIDFKRGLGDWLNYSVKGDIAWESDSQYGAKISGHNAGECETWLVSPAVAATNIELTFETWKNYDGNALQLLLSFDFDPLTMTDPNQATWEDITSQATWATEKKTWTESGTIESGELQAPCRIAFKYTCEADAAAQWEVSNLKVSGEALGLTDGATVTAMKVISGKGQIVVLSNKTEEIAVYAMTGAEVLRTQIVEGSNTIDLPAGIYIVNGIKAIVF